MTIIACDQRAIGWDDTCTECGGWLHTMTRGGYPAQIGRVCSEDCAGDESNRLNWQDAQHHLHTRDLLCDCATCTDAGHPSDAERQEWAAYEAGGGPL